MIYSELKEQVLNLGFESEDALDDSIFAKAFRGGINHALRFLNAEFPLIERQDVTMLGDDDSFTEIEFAELSDFDSILNATITQSVDGRTQILPFSDYTIEKDTLVKISNLIEGEVSIFYRQKPTAVTASTLDADTITVNYKAEPLVSLLAAYYIFADDDKEKAAMWRNEYEYMRDVILKNTPKIKPVTFIGGR